MHTHRFNFDPAGSSTVQPFLSLCISHSIALSLSRSLCFSLSLSLFVFLSLSLSLSLFLSFCLSSTHTHIWVSVLVSPLQEKERTASYHHQFAKIKIGSSQPRCTRHIGVCRILSSRKKKSNLKPLNLHRPSAPPECTVLKCISHGFTSTAKTNEGEKKCCTPKFDLDCFWTIRLSLNNETVVATMTWTERVNWIELNWIERWEWNRTTTHVGLVVNVPFHAVALKMLLNCPIQMSFWENLLKVLKGTNKCSISKGSSVPNQHLKLF